MHFRRPRITFAPLNHDVLLVQVDERLSVIILDQRRYIDGGRYRALIASAVFHQFDIEIYVEVISICRTPVVVKIP